MIVWKLHYNWWYTSEEGEDYYIHEVGKKGVKSILAAANSVVVIFEDDTREVIFNVNKLFSKPDIIDKTVQ